MTENMKTYSKTNTVLPAAGDLILPLPQDRKEEVLTMKKRLKAFTLIELVIVLALFSIVMFSVLQLLDPVSKFFVRSSNYETTTACIDNIKRAIEGNLKYADRVRVYSSFNALSGNIDEDGCPMTMATQQQVKEFWEYYFKDRELIDCEGTIYVMVFDSRPQNGGISGISKLGDFNSNERNSGKITRISIPFSGGADNTLDMTNKNVSVDDWYVNQKMYGNYNYRFALGTSDDFIMTLTSSETESSGEESSPVSEPDSSSESSGTPGVVFNPADCTIQISSYQVTREPGGNALSESDTPQKSFASFSMKNVLDATKKYASPLYDYKIVKKEKLVDHGALLDSIYTGGALSTADMKYYVDSTLVPKAPGSSEQVYKANPLVRYTSVVANGTPSAEEFDITENKPLIFYFIYTLPETTNDGDTSSVAEYSAYLDKVVSAYGS